MKKLSIVALASFYLQQQIASVYSEGGLNLANISTTNSGSADKNNTLATLMQASLHALIPLE
jgi:hypothetical protein